MTQGNKKLFESHDVNIIWDNREMMQINIPELFGQCTIHHEMGNFDQMGMILNLLEQEYQGRSMDFHTTQEMERFVTGHMNRLIEFGYITRN